MKYITYAFIALFVFLVSCNAPQNKKATTRTSSEKQKEVMVPNFNADSALQYVKAQTDFGPRVPNSAAHQACADYLIQTIRQFADTVYVQEAKVRAYNDDILNIKNIIASFQPEKKERILLGAHWDSRPYADHDPDKDNIWKPISGANDGASGIGVLIEMARLMKENKPDIGIDIIFFDGEDYGEPHSLQSNKQDTWGLGSQYWAKNPHVYGYEAKYGIILDMVGAENARFLRERFSTYYAEHVVDKVWAKAQSMGYGSYFVDEEGGPINDDHYYINDLIGIPTIDIIHLDTESTNGSFFDHWHTQEDTFDKINKETLRIVGEVVMHVVYHE